MKRPVLSLLLLALIFILSASASDPPDKLGTFLEKLEQMGCPAQASLELDAQALEGKWVEKNNPLKGAVMEFSAGNPASSGLERALIYANQLGSSLDYKWDAAHQAYVLYSHDKDIIGAIRVTDINGVKTIFIAMAMTVGQSNLSVTTAMARPRSLPGVKINHLGYDVFDWLANGENDSARLKIAEDIIALWTKYGDRANDPKLMTARGLMEAIDLYYTTWDDGKGQHDMFWLACEIAGVDYSSYMFE